MIEVIVASGIMVTAVASALTLVSSSINAENESEALIIAGNLAREGIEAVRAVRDSNWLASQDFDVGLEDGNGDHVAIPVFIPDVAARAATGGRAWTIDFTPTDIDDLAAAVYAFRIPIGVMADGLMVQAVDKPGGTVNVPWRRVVALDPLCDSGAGITVAPGGASCLVGTKVGIRVTSSVHWGSGTRKRSVELEERMMDWR